MITVIKKITNIFLSFMNDVFLEPRVPSLGEPKLKTVASLGEPKPESDHTDRLRWYMRETATGIQLLSDNFIYLKLKVYFTRLNLCIIEIIL